MNIGFIGFGEAAYCICTGLKQEGITGIAVYDIMMGNSIVGPRITAQVEQIGAKLCTCSCEVAQQSDVLFSAVPCTQSVLVAKEICHAIKPGTLYADLTASAPWEKEEIWELVCNRDVLFVDAAMLGSVPLDLHKVPIIASGNGASAFFKAMNPYGMQIEIVGEKAGEASAIKLVRSIYMKGMSAIMFEMMRAAEAYGVAEKVISSISKSMDHIPFEAHLNRLITGMAIHAKRRSVELNNSVNMQEKLSLDHIMSSAAQYTHDLIEQKGLPQKYNGIRPKNWQQVINDFNMC